MSPHGPTARWFIQIRDFLQTILHAFVTEVLAGFLGYVIASRLAVDLLEVNPPPTLYLIDAKHFVATVIPVGVKADVTEEAIVVHTLHGIKQRVASDLPSSHTQGFDRLNDHHGSIVGIRAIAARMLA